MMKRTVPALALLLALGACQDNSSSSRHLAPIPQATLSLMATKGMSKADPILIRAYKKESELEVWKQGADGRYALLKTYPICRWSGQLGPKRREGDRQAPEGFYTIGPGQMNPNSSFYLSFDTGYPNAYDRAQGGTGSHLMVHGSCSSRGCYAMTDEAIAEVYAIARESLAAGQRGFQFQAMPFRMTPKNLAQHRHDPHIAFWRNLKEGVDVLDATGQEPKVAVCNGRYTFGSGDAATCAPALDPRVAEKRSRDDQQVAALVAEGLPAIRLAYADGGQHASFRQAGAGPSESVDNATFHAPTPRRALGDVSRPEALAQGPQEILLEVNGKPRREGSVVAAAPAAGPKRAPAADGSSIQQAAAKPAEAVPVAAQPAATRSAAKPAAAKPAEVRSAEAGPAVVAAAAEPEAKPLYQRMAGRLGGLFVSADGELEPAPAGTASAATAEPVPPAPARRAVARPKPPAKQAEKQAEKPSASPAPQSPAPPSRRADPPKTIQGAQPILPVGAASGFTRLN